MKHVVYENKSNDKVKVLKSCKQAKRCGVLKLQALIIVFALVMASSVSAFASGSAASEPDPRKILTDSLTEMTDSIIDLMSLSAGTEYVQDFSKVSGELRYNATVSEAGLDSLLSALEVPQELAPIARLIFDAGLGINFDLDLSGIDPLIKLGIGLSVQNESLLNLESAIKKNVLYFGIAELYSQYFSVELDDYDMDVKDMIDDAANEMSYAMDVESYNQTLSDIKPLFDYFADYDEDLKKMMREIIETAVAEIDGIGYYDALKVNFNGKSVKHEGISIDLTEADTYNISIAVANLMLENRDYMRMTADIVNLANGYKSVTVSDIKEQLEYFLEEEYASYTDETVELNLYLDSDGNTIGYSIAAEDGSMSFLTDMQSSYEFLFDIEGELLRMYGSVNDDLSDAGGDLWIDYTPGEYSDMNAFNIKVLEFSGLNMESYATAQNQSVTMTFFLGDIISAFGDEILYDVPIELADYLTVSKLIMTLEQEGYNKSATKLELLLGDDISMEISLDMDTGTEISDETGFESSDLINVDDYIMYNVDIDEILGNLERIMAKIEEMGYNIDLLYDLLDSALTGGY